MKKTALLLSLIAASAGTGAAASFFRDIRPVLQRNCQGCHQPSVKQGNLDLTSFEAMQKGGSRGPAIPLLVEYITGKRQPRMPLGADPLPEDQIKAIREWVEAGAADDTPAEARETISLDKPPVYSQSPVVNAIAFSPDGTTLAVSGYREVLLHNADGSGILARLPGVSDRIHSILFSKDSKTLIAAGGTPARFGEVQVWDVGTRKLRRSITLTNDTVFGASLSPDGAHLAVGCTDNTLRILDLASGKELQKVPHHENWVLATVYGVNGKRLVSVGRDRAAKLTDAANGQFIENVNLLRGELSSVARHPTRDFVAIGGEDRIPYYYMMDRPRVMKIADDTTLIRKLEPQQGVILALAFSPDGSRLAVAGASPEAPIYNVETGQRTATLKGHKAGIYTVAFTSNGKQLATAGFDGTVRIYDAASGSLVKEFIPVPLTASVTAP
ncbi:MAG TPA: c-type cytochrome domain-containing protein [Bryobacteraceae bacterium]|nr:c-type cytochrome domain-containing protein [Bryobacteraceae bacterium]